MAELVNGKITRGWMWTAVDRAWIEMSRKTEARHPGWKLEYGLLGFTATPPGGGEPFGPASLRMIEQMIELTENPPGASSS